MRTFVALVLSALTPAVAAQTYYVATDGADQPQNGSAANEWATIGYAVDQVPDGATILVRPGTYAGSQRIDRAFATGITIRSEVPYQARLRHTGTVLLVYDGAGVTIEGFDIAHSGPGAGALVVQVQDIDGEAERITFRDNILHDSYNNDILKINNGASDIRVVGNLFYNQAGSDEHIDVNSVDGVVIEDNVFFNDYAASARAIDPIASSFIVVKDSNGADDEYVGAFDVTIRRNVFLNWQGTTGSPFVLFGEDGMPYYEADGALVENNLFLGNSPLGIRAAFGVKGSRNIVYRANTVAGDLPANAFAMRVNREGFNLVPTGLSFRNNVWSDPTGTMGAGNGSAANDFSDTPPADVGAFVLDRNLYWNGGAAIPDDAGEAIGPSDDANAVFGDPLLGSNVGAVTPDWNPGLSEFDGGHASIREAFVDLVTRYGTPAANGAGIGAADAANMPADDVLGNPRGATPYDLGAVELGAGGPTDVLFRNGFESVITPLQPRRLIARH